jgi:hypothetical protein
MQLLLMKPLKCSQVVHGSYLRYAEQITVMAKLCLIIAGAPQVRHAGLKLIIVITVIFKGDL